MVNEAIFRSEEGRQIKFFIQKDLDTRTIEDLQNQIEANGGKVEIKVPIQGFILIEPLSPEGLRLGDCWDTAERPLRNFVPYTFVAACLEAGKLLPQVFRRNGLALRMHIHPCITNEKMVETLRNRIWHSGGDPLSAEPEADVVISDEGTAGFRALVERYDHFHNKYVEAIPWVRQCVESGVYANTPVVKKNLGGRVTGNKRTEFTAADDNHLASYIACRLPDPTMRGRTGNKLYQDLCLRLDLYPWAERHPWQSWRERYKNNTLRFNRLVAAYLEQHPIAGDGKGLHGFVRVNSSPGKTQSKQPDAVRSMSRIANPLDAVTADGDWGSQWSVRVGHRSPPDWGNAKRKVIESHNGPEIPNKRNKHSDGNDDTRQSDRLLNVIHTERSATERNLQRPITGFKVFECGSSEVAETAGSLGTAIDGDEPSHASNARSLSPEGTTDIATSTKPAISSVDAGLGGQDVGFETQHLLDAHRNILTGLSKSHSPLSIVHAQLTKFDKPSMPAKPISITPSSTDVGVEHELVRIACEYRFILDEVKEEYEELSRDLNATRLHFKGLRAYIIERKSTRKKPLP